MHGNNSEKQDVCVYFYCVLYSLVSYKLLYTFEMLYVCTKRQMYFISSWSWLWSLKNGLVGTQCGPNCWISFSPIIIVGWSTRRMVGSVDSFEVNTHGEPDGSERTSSLSLSFTATLWFTLWPGRGLYRWSQRSRCALDSGREVVMTGLY